MIWSRCQKPTWSSPHDAANTAAAATKRRTVRSGGRGKLGRLGFQPRGLLPPRRRRQRGELERRLPARAEDDGEGPEHEQALEHLLQPLEVGDPLRVVLAPVPEAERRVADDLDPDRVIPEDA